MPIFNNQLAGASGQGGGYEIDQSIRFNDNDTAYLSRTNASAPTSTTVWTCSFWVKRATLGTNQYILNAGPFNFGDDFEGFYFMSNDTLRVQLTVSNSNIADYRTNALFRDASAWYNFVIVRDGQSYAVYVNGAAQTFGTSSFGSNPASYVNAATQHDIGNRLDNLQSFDGYLAEFYCVDGQALAPTDFGETNDDGVWIPKPFAGEYGSNGFYVTGEDSADLGADYSGNSNDFTSSGLTSDDQVTDTPTDNYATLSPISGGAGTLSNGNLSFTGNDQGRLGTFAIPSSGKWAFEVTMTTAPGGSAPIIGLSTINGPLNGAGSSAEYRGYRSDGNKISASVTSYGDTFTSGEVIEVLANMDDGELTFINEGVSQGVAFTDLISSGNTWFPHVNGLNGSCVFDLDFGQLGYTPSDAAYKSLNTANLPGPAIADGSAYFQTTLYTGNGTAIGSGGNAVSQIENSTFQPDFVWIKRRNSAVEHVLTDAVRGVTKELSSNDYGAEETVAEGLTTFGSSGFTVGSDGSYNTNTGTYAAWQWLAANGTASNTDGSVTSTVSANVDAGFSVIGYTASGTTGATVGHGLSQAPDFIIAKDRDSGANQWIVYHSAEGATRYALLNANSAFNTNSGPWNNTEPTSSLITLGSSSGWVNNTGNDHIIYCWHSVEGFSKFGKYTGNGSTDGPFVYCGFRPAFVIAKRTNSADNWAMYDAARDPYNVAEKYLYADLTNAETTFSTAKIDFLSNGFKWRGAVNFGNASGGTYIFLAFSENSFGGTGVAPATAR